MPSSAVERPKPGMPPGAPAERPLDPVFETAGDPAPQNEVDRFVFEDLRRRGIQPARLCSDAVFLRRAFLDVTGTLPSAAEASQFLADPDLNKRHALIDRLLERQEFASYWAMKWSDLLRVKAEFPINLWPNAAQAYHRWIRTSLRDNKPYDRFARELLTESGSNFRVPPVNFYRAMQNRSPEGIAKTVALTFLGVRAENWPKQRLADMAVFFSRIGYKQTGEWKEEIVFLDPSKPAARSGILPDGARAPLSPDRDPREAFADWLIQPHNPWFARNVVNRIWSWLLGRGIIHEPDDIRPDNPPSNPDLLALLERELIAARYDLKQIYRLLLHSSTYQLSSLPGSDNPAAAAHFSSYPVRRLEAEVLADALCQLTGATDTYTSAIPEPYTVMPEGQRAIGLPDGSISSAFLDLFGRPARDTGLESERNNRISAAQRLHLLNSTHVQRKIRQGPAIRDILQPPADPRAVVANLYLAILSRRPTPGEWTAAAEYSRASGVRGREAALDLAWALINTAEFLYRH